MEKYFAYANKIRLLFTILHIARCSSAWSKLLEFLVLLKLELVLFQKIMNISFIAAKKLCTSIEETNRIPADTKKWVKSSPPEEMSPTRLPL